MTGAEVVAFEIRGEGWALECALQVLVGLAKYQLCRLPLYAACGKSGNGPPLGRVNPAMDIDILTFTDIRAPSPHTTHPAQLATNTGSDESMMLVRQWIESCQDLHPSCIDFGNGGGNEQAFQPTRLVDVTTSPARLRLREQSSGAVGLPYLAFSHCWGNSHKLLLLSSNIAQFQTAIPEHDLPLNVQQAFSIARRLYYPSIWIDTLCIIQDSMTDWLTEAPLMAEIYGGSVCTIAAAGANGNISCFTERDALARRPCRIQSDIYVHGYASRPSDTVHLHEKDPVSSRWEPGNPPLQVMEDVGTLVGLESIPLLSRRWVVQERLLSPRVVYFGLQGLVWQCCSKNASEFWPDLRIFDEQMSEDLRGSTKINFARAVSSVSSSVKSVDGRLTRGWDSVVNAYAMAKLSRESDHYIALVGLASFVQRRTAMTFVAGHWEELMPENLLWQVARPDVHIAMERRIRDLPLQAASVLQRTRPSWSWMTASKTIIHDASEKKLSDYKVTNHASCSVMDFCPPTDADHVPATLEVYDLSIQAPLVRVYFPRNIRGRRVSGEYVCHPRQSGSSTSVRILRDIPLSPESEVYLALLRTLEYKVEQRPWRGPPHPLLEDETCEQGLVLIPVGGKRNAFWRVGIFDHLTTPGGAHLPLFVRHDGNLKQIILQ
jgi:hypothetical protein